MIRNLGGGEQPGSDKVVRGDFFSEGTSELRTEGQGVGHSHTWGQGIPGRGNSKDKGPGWE